MRKYIPNIITLMNLSAGTLAIYFVLFDRPGTALILMGIALLMDFADGLAARLLHAYSDLGKQLDSLADLISFGLVPAAMVFKIFQTLFFSGECESSDLVTMLLPFTVLIIPVFSAIRLGRFNLQEDSVVFLGLPVPANAMFWSGIYYEVISTGMLFDKEPGLWFYLSVLLLLSVLMVVNISMLSLKFKNFRFRDNFLRYMLIAAGFVIFLLTGISGLPVIILMYILISIGVSVLT
ncbi:MAG TPA: CDP-alcohol phosphatidyltransferase family protein [Bacteroidales bacterium]|nr:CDP-alcohol phosphatidyltransferase family protein [Bacteroidales bacterium]